MQKKPLRVTSFVRKIEQMTFVRAVRGGLVNMIPVLIIGAFALVFRFLPIDGYREFIESFAGGVFDKIFLYVNSATFGVLSVYMTYSISRSYMKVKADPETVNGGAVFASLVAFFILSGAFLEDFGSVQMGVKSMVLAIIAGLGASALYLCADRFFRRRRSYLFSPGADREFNRMLSSFIPILVVTAVFGILNTIILFVSRDPSIHALYIRAMNAIFSHIKAGFLKGFCFVLVSSILWFFGVHGSDALEGVMSDQIVGGMSGEILSNKAFFDCFVLMGGCGTTICLLIALLAFSRNRAQRRLGITAALPMLCNINELMVFGLPIVFNPVMLIPFLAVPLVCYSVSYLAAFTGLVPVIDAGAEIYWTTPILLGGFKAGGIRGLLLQLFLVLVGVAIYFPFVRLLDRESERNGRRNFSAFMEFFREHEAELQNKRVVDLDNVYSDVAKSLSADIRDGMSRHMTLYYQPQYDYGGKCVGVEALLRWKHPVYGILYPPLVVKLVTESNLLAKFEEAVLEKALSDRPAVLRQFGEDVKLSVNVTGSTVSTPRFIAFCRKLNEKEPFAGKNLCIEVTEQTALDLGSETRGYLNELREMGLLLAIDDFSMGQTSLHYLKDNLFHIIKIDGSLVRGLNTSQNCREIIFSITGLAESLSLPVIAEFVETAEQREILHGIGCDCYQGYLYSPAVPLEAAAKTANAQTNDAKGSEQEAE